MKLPVIIPEIRSQSWSCHGCTNCCRELVVHLTADDRRRIDEQGWARKLGTEPYVRHSSGIVLNHAAGGGCVFLLDDGKCRIHAELGLRAKPLACQIYPFTLEREGDSARAAIRFDCPSVTKNDGGPLSSHRRDIQHVVDEICRTTPALLREDPDVIAFSQESSINRAQLDHIVARLGKWIDNPRQSFNDRVTGLCSIYTALNQAKLQRLGGAGIAELVEMLAGDLPNVVAESGDTAAEPTAGQIRTLHQSAFAHCGYLQFAESRMSLWRSLRYRFDQLKQLRAMLRGAGPIPKLLHDGVSTTFEDLGEVQPMSGADSDDAADLLTRYLLARVVNRNGFGRSYYNWPVLDGLGASLLALAVVGWFARRSAAGAERAAVSIEDVRSAVAVVDRTAGRSPELGAKSAKLRLLYLTQDDGILRLIRRYGILSR